jgi:hypothetical protein
MSMSELMLISSSELTLMASEYDDCVCEFITITLLSLSVLFVLAFVAFIFSFFFFARFSVDVDLPVSNDFLLSR